MAATTAMCRRLQLAFVSASARATPALCAIIEPIRSRRSFLGETTRRRPALSATAAELLFELRDARERCLFGSLLGFFGSALRFLAGHHSLQAAAGVELCKKALRIAWAMNDASLVAWASLIDGTSLIRTIRVRLRRRSGIG